MRNTGYIINTDMDVKCYMCIIKWMLGFMDAWIHIIPNKIKKWEL